MANGDEGAHDQKPFLSNTNAILALIFGTVLTGVTGLANLYFSITDHPITREQLLEDLHDKKTQTDLLVAKAHDDRILVVYHEAGDALAKNDVGRQFLALALAKNLLRDDADKDLAAGVNAMLQTNSHSDIVKKAAAEQQYVAEQGASPPPPPATTDDAGRKYAVGAYNIDVFWCDGAGDVARHAVDSIAAKLVGATPGRVRTRILPASRNHDAGYRANGVQVRYEEPSERTAALAVRDQIRQPLHDVGMLSEPQLYPVRTPTPGYLSVFVCPASAPGPAPGATTAD